MTWLALRIFGYLLVAGFIGVAAGWLLAKVARRDRWHVQVLQARAEAFDLRRQLERQADELAQLQHAQSQRAQMQVISPQEARLSQRASVAEQPVEVAFENDVVQETILVNEAQLADLRMQQSASEDLIRALHREIVRLRLAAEQSASVPKPSPSLELTVKELEGRLVRKMGELDRLQQALNSEEKKVRELERERELQNKSLLVLHQQLEMERKPHRATG